MSARQHEQQTRTSDSGPGVLDVWLPFCGAGGFEIRGGGPVPLGMKTRLPWKWPSVVGLWVEHSPQCGAPLVVMRSFSCWHESAPSASPKRRSKSFRLTVGQVGQFKLLRIL